MRTAGTRKVGSIWSRASTRMLSISAWSTLLTRLGSLWLRAACRSSRSASRSPGWRARVARRLVGRRVRRRADPAHVPDRPICARRACTGGLSAGRKRCGALSRAGAERYRGWLRWTSQCKPSYICGGWLTLTCRGDKRRHRKRACLVRDSVDSIDGVGDTRHSARKPSIEALMPAVESRRCSNRRCCPSERWHVDPGCRVGAPLRRSCVNPGI